MLLTNSILLQHRICCTPLRRWCNDSPILAFVAFTDEIVLHQSCHLCWILMAYFLSWLKMVDKFDVLKRTLLIQRVQRQFQWQKIIIKLHEKNAHYPRRHVQDDIYLGGKWILIQIILSLFHIPVTDQTKTQAFIVCVQFG